jgi:hypothetical protein
MATLKIIRPRIHWLESVIAIQRLPEANIPVFVGGRRVASIRPAGKTIEFEIAPGRHHLSAGTIFARRPLLEIEAAADETHQFALGRKSRSPTSCGHNRLGRGSRSGI